MLFPENAPRVLFAHLVGSAFIREADKLGKWRVRPTATAAAAVNKWWRIACCFSATSKA
jgi:hypothetical protein